MDWLPSSWSNTSTLMRSEGLLLYKSGLACLSKEQALGAGCSALCSAALCSRLPPPRAAVRVRPVRWRRCPPCLCVLSTLPPLSHSSGAPVPCPSFWLPAPPPPPTDFIIPHLPWHVHLAIRSKILHACTLGRTQYRGLCHYRTDILFICFFPPSLTNPPMPC
jgi:hypothetical protein